MRVSIHRGLSGQAAAAPAMGNAMLVVTGAEFLLSMVEARWAARNGDGRKMDAGHKSQQELQKIEQQLKKVQSLDGQDESTRREIWPSGYDVCRYARRISRTGGRRARPGRSDCAQSPRNGATGNSDYYGHHR